MIPERLSLRGMSVAFPGAVDVDFTAIPGDLVAVLGQNGSGKSHLLEAMGPAALYREWASYGEAIAAHVAPGCRDAGLDYVFSLHGHQYRVLLQIDPEFGGGRGKSEAYLFRDGVPLVGPSVRDFDAAIAELFPPRDIFLASVFACQSGEGSFWDLSKAARKDLFVRMLGLSRLQEQSEQARERAGGHVARLERLRDDLRQAELVAARMVELQDRLRGTEHRIGLIDEAATAVEAEAEAAAAQVETLDAEHRRLQSDYDAAVAVRAQAEQRRNDIEARVLALDRQRSATENALLQKTAILEAAERAQALTAQMSDLEQQQRVAAERLAEVRATREAKRATRDGLAAEYKRLAADLQGAKQSEAALHRVPALQQQESEHKRALATLEMAIRAGEEMAPRLEANLAAEAETARQRAILMARRQDIESRGALLERLEAPDSDLCRRCPLTVDAREAATSLEDVRAALAALPDAPGSPAAEAFRAVQVDLAANRKAQAAAVEALHGTQRELLALEEHRRRAGSLPGIQEALDANVAQGQSLTLEIQALTTQETDGRAAVQTVAGQMAALRRERDGVAALAARAAEIPVRDQELGRVRDEISRALTALETVQAELAALPTPTPPVLDSQALVHWQNLRDAARERARDQRRLHREELDTAASIRGQLEVLGEAPKCAAIRDELDVVAAEAEAWTLLSQALGRDGVQALEIDAAGPGVTAIANELLGACYGPRFTLKIETTAAKKSGRGDKEVFDVVILDGEKGRSGQRGSAGEMVILDEALRLAIAIYVGQRTGSPLRTLWRDETTGALSPENANAYVKMLREAKRLGGFDRVYFITHAPDVWEQADARIWVQHGQITIDAPMLAAA